MPAHRYFAKIAEIELDQPIDAYAAQAAGWLMHF